MAMGLLVNDYRTHHAHPNGSRPSWTSWAIHDALPIQHNTSTYDLPVSAIKRGGDVSEAHNFSVPQWCYNIGRYSMVKGKCNPIVRWIQHHPNPPGIHNTTARTHIDKGIWNAFAKINTTHGRGPGRVSGLISSFNRITPDVGPSYHSLPISLSL